MPAHLRVPFGPGSEPVSMLPAQQRRTAFLPMHRLSDDLNSDQNL